MSITTAKLSLYDSRNYRSVPVAVPFDRWCRYLLCHPSRRLQYWRYEVANGLSKIICIPLTAGFSNPCRKVQTQIPIALLPILTSVARPAVSSLEAS